MSTVGRDDADSVSVSTSSTFSGSVSEAIFSLRKPNSGSVWGSSEVCCCSVVFGIGNSVSWSLTGELQNLLAKEEDLYGADLQRVKSKAFLGGVLELEAKSLSLSTFTLSWNGNSDSWS